MKAGCRALLLPGLVLLVVGVWQGPALWERFYPSVKEYCLMYLANASAWTVALPVLGSLALVTFGAGAATLVLQLRGAWRLSQTVAAQAVPMPVRLSQALQQQRIKAPVTCIQEKAPVAFCHGFRSAGICVSSGLVDLLNAKELAAVLAHEAAHARKQHPLRTLLARVMSAALFPFPLTKLVEGHFLVSLELEADRYAMTQVSAPHLAAALFKMLQTNPINKVFQGGVPLNPTEERIRYLLGDKREPLPLLRRSEAIASGVLTAGVALLGAGVIGGTSHLLSSGPLCRPPML